MKKFLSFGLFALIMVITTISCTKLSSDSRGYIENLVENRVDEYIQQYVENPTFETIADVTAFQLHQKEDRAIDSVFYSLPISKLVNVSSVLLNKNGVTSKEEIVAEYLDNIDIYNNLVTDYPYQHLDEASNNAKNEIPIPVVDNKNQNLNAASSETNKTVEPNPTPVATTTQPENVTETKNTNNVN